MQIVQARFRICKFLKDSNWKQTRTTEYQISYYWSSKDFRRRIERPTVFSAVTDSIDELLEFLFLWLRQAKFFLNK